MKVVAPRLLKVGEINSIIDMAYLIEIAPSFGELHAKAKLLQYIF
jgi:hypothetical protein